MLRLFLLVTALLALVIPAAHAEPRLALIVGNAKYGQEMGRLPNPANDADLMAKTLTKLGFQVTKLVDADQKQMKRAIVDFGSALQAAGPDAVGLFFYAGHGVQIAGENYLIPLDSRIEKEADVEVEAVSANNILKQMEFAGNRINIVILDACRNNPMSRSMRSATRGLARMDAPMGSFIAYSTAPGEVAADGTGRNSPYTAALTKAMLTPGVAIEETFRNARVEVLAETNKQQIPWESSSLTGAFFFQEGPAPAAVAAAAPAAPAEPAAPQTTPAAKSLPGGISAGQAIKDCPECPTVIALASGAFVMGAGDQESDGQHSERPQQDISVPPFAIGQNEVTRGEFAAFVKESGYQPSNSCWGQRSNGKWAFINGNDWQDPGFEQGDDEPVVCVSPNDAKAYVAWLTEKTGNKYRLPSEAEWEYAARAGANGRFYWSDDEDAFCSNGNIADQAARRKYRKWNVISCDDGYTYTAPAGSFRENAFGLHDVLGNAREIAADCWSEDLTGTDASARPRGNGSCTRHVVRGSGWDSGLNSARLATRDKTGATEAHLYIGFRVARDF